MVIFTLNFAILFFKNNFFFLKKKSARRWPRQIGARVTLGDYWFFFQLEYICRRHDATTDERDGDLMTSKSSLESVVTTPEVSALSSEVDIVLVPRLWMMMPTCSCRCRRIVPNSPVGLMLSWVLRQTTWQWRAHSAFRRQSRTLCRRRNDLNRKA